MDVQPGQRVNFKDDVWMVIGVDSLTERIELQRTVAAGGLEVILVDAENFFRDQVDSEVRESVIIFAFKQQMFGTDRTRSQFVQEMIGAWGRKPVDPPQGTWQNLQNLADQWAQFGEAFAAGNMQPEVEAEEKDMVASRKAELDARFNDPEGDGFFVFWREKLQRLPGVRIEIDGLNMGGGWDSYGKENVHECGTLDDAWAFVDYLKDDEAGEAIAIREDAVVLFYRKDAGWEPLTNTPVPDEYYEQ